MRRNYQQVLYDTIKWTAVENSRPANYGLNADEWYKITSTGTTVWPNYAVSTSWKNEDGTPWTSGYTLTTGGAAFLGKVFCVKAGAPAITGDGYVAPVTKMYTPNNYVNDIYIKNGAYWNHGGDFYSQQNTNQNQGGANSFVCLENNIPWTGNGNAPSNPRFPLRNGGPTTYCGFNANGGGFVTNLLYNYYIRHILHDSYQSPTNNNYWNWAHNISFKALKLQSQVQKELISCVGINSSGSITFPVWGSIWTLWYQSFGFGPFTNCFFGDYFGSVRMPFSNETIFNGQDQGVGSGKLNITGSTIDLSSGSFNSTLPVFLNDTSAAPVSPGAPSGAKYINPITGKPMISIGTMYRTPSGEQRVRTV